LQLRIPKLRQGTYFPPFLEARKGSEKALVAAIQEAWIGGVSTRRVDDLVKAMGRLWHVYILETRKGSMPGWIRAEFPTSVWVQFSPWLFNVTRPFGALQILRGWTAPAPGAELGVIAETA